MGLKETRVAREGGRQPGYLESIDLAQSHPSKPALGWESARLGIT